MKNDRQIGLLLGAAVLMGAAADVSALTVGRIRGGALLGQPLQLSIPVQYAADEDIGPSCFSAEVWYGESRQDLGRTSVTLEPAAAGQPAQVRIRVSAPVTEPVVQVSLVAGCKDKITRRYSVLADALTVPADSPAVQPGVPSGATTYAEPVRPVAAPVGIESSAARPAALAGPSQPVAKPVAKSSGSKLTLTPADGKPVAASPKSGNASGAAWAAQAAQLESLEKRVGAVEEWKGQQTNPDGSPRSEARLKAIEGDLKGLQALGAKNQQNLQLLTQAVDKVQAEQSSSGLLYVMGALLAASVAALGFVVMKVRGTVQQAMPWWRAGAQNPSADAGAARAATVVKPQPSPTVPSVRPAPVAPIVKAPPATPAVEVDLDIGVDGPAASDVSEARPSAPMPMAPERVDKRDFQPSGSASLRAINTQEMLDVRQQAEFFMALGQHDDAIRALESSIHASADSNPLVYLDLLRVLHTLSRRAEFDRYRSEFNHIFTGKVPDYPSFHEEGYGLDAYADICRQIAELWPSDDALDYIEQCLVRTPEDGEEDGFDMEAFRDLLMLHGMLRRMGDASDSRLQPFITSRSAGVTAASPVPLAAPAPTDAARSAPQEPPHAPVVAAAPPLAAAPAVAAAAPVVPNLNVVDPGGAAADLAAASRDLDLPSPPSSAGGADIELDLDLGAAEEKPGNLIDFDISISDYETKDESVKKT